MFYISTSADVSFSDYKVSDSIVESLEATTLIKDTATPTAHHFRQKKASYCVWSRIKVDLDKQGVIHYPSSN